MAREISKLHEEHVRGTLQELVDHFQHNEPLGEIVLILAGKNGNVNPNPDVNPNCQLSTVNSQLSMLMGTGKKKNK